MTTTTTRRDRYVSTGATGAYFVTVDGATAIVARQAGRWYARHPRMAASDPAVSGITRQRAVDALRDHLATLPTADDAPAVLAVTRQCGIAGQESYTARVQYPDDVARSVTFVGSVYGGPVVMVLESGGQTFVTDPGRFGTFGESWIRRFFGEES